MKREGNRSLARSIIIAHGRTDRPTGRRTDGAAQPFIDFQDESRHNATLWWCNF